MVPLSRLWVQWLFVEPFLDDPPLPNAWFASDCKNLYPRFDFMCERPTLSFDFRFPSLIINLHRSCLSTKEVSIIGTHFLTLVSRNKTCPHEDSEVGANSVPSIKG